MQGYHVEIGGEPRFFPRRIELLGHGIDELLLELEEHPAQRIQRDGKRWVRDERKPFAYRYCRPHPLILQALAASSCGLDGESGPFFGDPNWFLHVIRREDGDLLLASANRIIATTWLAFEPARKVGVAHG